MAISWLDFSRKALSILNAEAASQQQQHDSALAQTQELYGTESASSALNVLKRKRSKKAGRSSLRIDLNPSLMIGGGFGPPTIGI